MAPRSPAASRAAALAAAQAIHARRAAADARALEMFPDLHEDLLGVIEYVAARPGRDRRADALACLTIADHLRGVAEHWQVRMVENARTHGARWVELAPLLGVTTAQGAEQAYLRAKRAQSGTSRDERAVRAERAHGRALRAVARAAAEVRDVVAALAEPGLLLPEELREDAATLWEDVVALAPGEAPSPGVVAGLRLLVRALASHDDLTEQAEEVTRRAAVLVGLPLRPPTA